MRAQLIHAAGNDHAWFPSSTTAFDPRSFFALLTDDKFLF